MSQDMETQQHWTIHIRDTDEQYSCSTDQHLLKGMLQLGRKGIPSGCHGGGCGVCKVRIVSGDVETITMSRAHVSEEEQQQGFALACRCFPRSDISLDVVGKMQKTVCKRRYGFV